MRDTLENKFSMFGSVETLLDANTAKTASITAFEPAFLEFKTIKSEIPAKETERIGATPGKTAAKKQAQTALIDETVRIASALRVLGNATNDPVLIETGNKKKSYFQSIRDTDLVPEVQLILNAANANAAALAGYGVTAANLTGLQVLIEAYEPALGSRELSVGSRAAAGDALEKLFDKADNILKNFLDGMMENFRYTDTQFYNEYKNARKIVNLGGGGDGEDPTPPNP